MSLFKQPSELVHKVDPSLDYYDTLGEGGYGIVYLVGMHAQLYALKVAKSYDEDTPSLSREFLILRKVEGIEGIPKALNFYPSAFREQVNGIKRLLDCYLMEYVPGKNVLLDEYPGKGFFERLEDIGNQVADRGCTLPSDLNVNVLIDNAKNPWVIDFMLSSQLASRKRLRKRNRNLVKKLEELVISMDSDKGNAWTRVQDALLEESW